MSFAVGNSKFLLFPQVWEYKTKDGLSTTSNDFVDLDNFEITLSPKTIDDEFLIEFTGHGSGSNQSSGNGHPQFRLIRNGEPITDGEEDGSTYTRGSGIEMQSTSFKLIDKPETLDPVTYKIQWRRRGSSNTARLNLSTAGANTALSSFHITKVRKQS